MAIRLILLALLGGCGTAALNADGTYAIPAEYMNAPAVPEVFMNRTQLDRVCGPKKNGCAVGIGTSDCWAALFEWLRMENGPQLDYVRRHERAHCAGWHHRGE